MIKQSVSAVEQLAGADPHQGVDDAADRHRHEAPQRDRGEPPRGQLGVSTAAQRVDEEREQPACPQRGGDQVDEQAVGGQVV